MSQCLHPDCLAVNPETHRFCQQCGQKLWLKDRYQALKLIGQGGFGKTFLAIDHDKLSKPRCVITPFFPRLLGDIKNGKMRLNALGAIADQYWQEIPQHGNAKNNNHQKSLYIVLSSLTITLKELLH
jgi:serine/threonine protein kinase